jgi:peptidoglycan/LPS O-acetylase OafA/YrhL
MKQISRENNFDLLRLFAALQVVIWHSIEHLQLDMDIVRNIIQHFHGVPVFFTISGFLIAGSYITFFSDFYSHNDR